MFQYILNNHRSSGDDGGGRDTHNLHALFHTQTHSITKQVSSPERKEMIRKSVLLNRKETPAVFTLKKQRRPSRSNHTSLFFFLRCNTTRLPRDTWSTVTDLYLLCLMKPGSVLILKLWQTHSVIWLDTKPAWSPHDTFKKPNKLYSNLILKDFKSTWLLLIILTDIYSTHLFQHHIMTRGICNCACIFSQHCFPWSAAHQPCSKNARYIF